MTIRPVRTALLVRPSRRDDRGSIPMLMLVMIVSTALGGVLLTSIIRQTHTTRFDQTRVRALHAAQTGIDLVLGQVRAAIDPTKPTTGDAGRLPCGPWSGAADSAGTATYAVSIDYYTANPPRAPQPGHTVDRPGGSGEMLCTSAGPYDPTETTRTPRYALITSHGSDGAAVNGASQGRTIQTTYVFKVNDVNISGGQIRIFPAGSTQWCMDAGPAPAAGTSITLQPCSTSNPPISEQVWAYRSDLSIELVSSATPGSAGLCIDTSPRSHAAGDAVVLKPCTVPDAAVCAPGYTPTTFAAAFPGKTCAVSPYDQQWSVDDNAHLRGASSDQTDTDGYCIEAASQTAGTALVLEPCAGGVTDTAQTWIPSPTTGAGMAGAGNTQLVNYKQFATCLDVTGQDPEATYLILYTCKQNPNPAKVAWNQKFTPSPALAKAPTQVLLEATAGGITYCLDSPRTAGGYPVLATPCPSSVSAAAGSGFVWTVAQRYSDSAGTEELPYAERYTIKDASSTPLCLGPGANSDLHNGQYYKAIVAACDGSTGQKWNADASLDTATLTDTHEIGTSGG